MTEPAPRPRLRERLTAPATLGPVLVWLATRLLIFGTAIVVQFGEPAHGLLARADWPARLLLNWDGFSFLGIAQHGYFSAESLPTWPAYFPGYPYLSKLLALPFGLGETPVIVAMALVANLAALGSALLIWRIAADRFGSRVALVATVLLLAGPYALFLAASYSEALFLFFALLAWRLGSREHWWLAGLAGAAASFTRINGVVLAAALLTMYLLQRHAAGRPLLRPPLIGALLAGLGTLAYFGMLFLRTGSLTTWSTAQSIGWDRVLQWPWQTFYETAGRVLFASTLDRRIQFGFDILFAAVLIAAIVVLARRREWPSLVFVGLTALSLMTSFTYLSLARNTATLFPLVLLLAPLVLRPKGRAVVIAVIVLSAAILLFDTRQFTLGLWAD